MKLKLPYRSKGWTTAPISPTCEKLAGIVNGRHTFCDRATSYAYPSDGGGWMALCSDCGQKHLPHIFTIEELIESGETFEGAKP